MNADITAELEALIAKGLRFGTIYVDPPWAYGNTATRAAATDHYSTMTVEQLAALPVERVAADKSHLHLWTTNAFLFEAKTLIERWGFVYKSCFVWVKPQMGMGNYWRVSHEFLLLGSRGQCAFLRRDLRSWATLARGPHSGKPEQVRAMIEQASPSERLEMFGRRRVDGWTVVGNQIERQVYDPPDPEDGERGG